MEGLTNISQSYIDRIAINIVLIDCPVCYIAGIWFVERESRYFGIEEKIKKLDEIINNVLNKLNDICDENKENYINTIKAKQNDLLKLATEYRKIENKFVENDKYYRKNLFEFYQKKYFNSPLFAFAEKRKYLSVMNDIQYLLKEKFNEYCNDYSHIRDSFFEINNYIIKIKKLYNIQD